ncbi:hypothetical protein CONLIGDRAFT_403400 [Coniochaeta ligniaria NRRL 30616]|uniref:Uncharacterized protein n=1 Tax=Coniochaeta ligniaria NRRL 30616 TaxID=1408157 RepID=A0A1J7JI91_9PEZI|nr:hypothetical protein CONLIGDRAFT_403400 [Coniochaeta ligniaria NRRL 30616]
MRTEARYHDRKSISSFSNTAKSFTSEDSVRKAVDMASGPGGSFTPNSNDEGPSTGDCASPRCSAKSMPERNLCSLHSGQKLYQSQTLASTPVHGPRHHTTKTKLPPDHGPQSVLPMTRRKTGSTSGVRPPGSHSKTNASVGGVINPSSFYSKINGSTTTANKPTQEARSPPDSSDDAGPARKKQRLGTDSVASSAARPDDTFKKPWNTGFNPRPTTKPPEEALSKPGKRSETGGSSTTKQRLPTNKTQRKFAPRIPLEPAFKAPNVTGNEPRDRSISDSPLPNKSAPRGTSHSTGSPQSHGKEVVGNESLRAWFQRRESVKPEPRSRTSNILNDSMNSFPLAGASFEKAASVASTNSVVDERRGTPVDHWVLPSALIDTPPKDTPKPGSGRFLTPQLPAQPPKQQPASKQLLLSQQHLEGWAFVPAPAPNKAQRPEVPGQTVSDLDFDSLIYRQEGAASPPRGIPVNIQKTVRPPPPPKPEPPDEPFYTHIDPRVHWSQEHSSEWYEKKLQEIQARGGRKANFGKAAQRLKQQREKEGPVSFEDSLPEKIRQNSAWVRALKELHEEPQEEASRRKSGQRGPKAGRQGLKRQASTAGPTTPRKA